MCGLRSLSEAPGRLLFLYLFISFRVYFILIFYVIVCLFFKFFIQSPQTVVEFIKPWHGQLESNFKFRIVYESRRIPGDVSCANMVKFHTLFRLLVGIFQSLGLFCNEFSCYFSTKLCFLCFFVFFLLSLEINNFNHIEPVSKEIIWVTLKTYFLKDINKQEQVRKCSDFINKMFFLYFMIPVHNIYTHYQTILLLVSLVV